MKMVQIVGARLECTKVPQEIIFFIVTPRSLSDSRLNASESSHFFKNHGIGRFRFDPMSDWLLTIASTTSQIDPSILPMHTAF